MYDSGLALMRSLLRLRDALQPLEGVAGFDSFLQDHMRALSSPSPETILSKALGGADVMDLLRELPLGYKTAEKLANMALKGNRALMNSFVGNTVRLVDTGLASGRGRIPFDELIIAAEDQFIIGGETHVVDALRSLREVVATDSKYRKIRMNVYKPGFAVHCEAAIVARRMETDEHTSLKVGVSRHCCRLCALIAEHCGLAIKMSAKGGEANGLAACAPPASLELDVLERIRDALLDDLRHVTKSAGKYKHILKSLGEGDLKKSVRESEAGLVFR
ncbi:hypothetical protein LTR36_010450 [Oleoguttula mirabilis]|uniref:Uncharacterized protein n=1 Tax=Oleoguttula mirabilis TaxID=1507867 RepID=A0AAV9J4S2_9PEZI|nr:hypothetical protein LTR36_010450 [Oleoguttula mirabilis]